MTRSTLLILCFFLTCALSAGLAYSQPLASDDAYHTQQRNAAVSRRILDRYRNEVDTLAGAQPDTQTVAQLYFRVGLTRDELADWIDTCHCEVTNVRGQAQAEGQHIAMGAMQFMFYEGTTRERLIEFETETTTRTVRMQQHMEQLSETLELQQHTSPPTESEVAAIMPLPFFDRACEDDSQPALALPTLDYVYNEVDVVATHSALKAISDTDLVFVRLLPETVRQQSVENYNQVLQLDPPLRRPKNPCTQHSVPNAGTGFAPIGQPSIGH